MDLACPACAFTTTLPEGQAPPEGARATCPSCGTLSVYLRGGLVDDQATPPRGLAPLPAREAATEVVASSGWRLRTVAGEEGPYELDALKTMVRTGTLHADDQALAPGDTEWRRAGDLPALTRYFKLKQAAPLLAAASGGATPCFMHPSRPCAFHCTACGTMACAECAVEREIRMLKVRLCPRCEQVVQPWVPTKVIVPFWKELPALLAYPVKGLASLGLVGCAVVGSFAMLAGAVGGIYGTFAYLVVMACLIAFHLMIIQDTVAGGRRVPDLSKLEDVWRQMIWPGARGFLVSIVVFLGPGLWGGMQLAPAAAAVATHEAALEMARGEREAFERGDFDEPTEAGAGFADSSVNAEAAQALDSLMAQGPGGDIALPGLTYREEPRDLDYYTEQERTAQRDLERSKGSRATATVIFWLLVLIAFIMWPIFLIVVALFNTVMPAFQPTVLVRIIGEIQKEYAWCVLFSTTCFIASELVALAFQGMPILGTSFSNPVSYYFSFIAFHVMGRTAEMAEQKIDWH